MCAGKPRSGAGCLYTFLEFPTHFDIPGRNALEFTAHDIGAGTSHAFPKIAVRPVKLCFAERLESRMPVRAVRSVFTMMKKMKGIRFTPPFPPAWE